VFGKQYAPRIFLGHFESQTREGVIGVGANLVWKQIAILRVKDKEKPIQKNQRTLTELVEVGRVKGPASLAIGGRKRSAKPWENLAKDDIGKVACDPGFPLLALA